MTGNATAGYEWPWEPHAGQGEVWQSDARFRIVACGRRWGKTELAANIAAVRGLQEPDQLLWWCAPTYPIAEIGLNTVREALPRPLVDEIKRTQPKAITLVNGSRISFRSADREDALRGEGLDLLILDEAAMIPERAWTAELRPTLSDTLGDMVAISTPTGRGWFYHWFERGQSEDHPDVESWQAPTYRNPHVPDDEVEAARREQPERVFRQEYLAEFVDETGGVFAELDEHLFTADHDLETFDGEPPYYHGWDLARHEDWTVGVVLDAHGALVHFDRMRGLSWPQIQRRIETAASDYEGTVAIDASRDNKLVSDLADAGLRIAPVKFSTQRKQDLVENLAAAIEGGDISAPEIPQLRHELEVFEYEVTAAGNVRYHAPEGFKDDGVDALALSNWARIGKAAAEPRTETRRRSGRDKRGRRRYTS